MLAELEMHNRQVARQDLLAAVWEGAESSRLLPLAEAAGLSGREADEMIGRVEQAKEWLAEVDRLPGLRRDAAGASGRLDKVRARAAAKIARLEDQVRSAAFEAETAIKAVHAAEDLSRRLLTMYDEGLLAHADTPQEVLRLIARRNAEETFQRFEKVRVAAFDERNRCRTVVCNIQKQLAELPVTISSQRDEAMLRERLKDAKDRLAENESSLKNAQAAAEAARKAIP